MKKLIGRVIIWALALAVLATVIGLMVSGRPADAATNPVSGLPAMGYNTWYQFGAGISESNVLGQARELVSSGLAAAGYDTVTIDDGWQGATAQARNADSRPLTWNRQTFPHGIPWLAQQLGAMGLKLGIYTAIGRNTCTNHGQWAGSYGHYSQDAALFRSWGASFVKVDSCKAQPPGTGAAQLTSLFRQFGSYITADGMTYSHELPVLMPVGSAEYMSAVRAASGWSEQWRVAPDETPLNSARATIIGGLQNDLHLHGYAGPGHWNDLDMLVPGVPAAHKFGFTLADEQNQLAVWAIEASPLFISTDLGSLTAAGVAALKNPHVLAIDQSGAQATGPLAGHVQALVKGADGGKALLLANTGTGTASAKFTLRQLGISSASVSDLNVWTGTTGRIGGITVTLRAGQTALYVLR